jgi:hypothetical protein
VAGAQQARRWWSKPERHVRKVSVAKTLARTRARDAPAPQVGIAPDITIDDSLDESPEPGKLPPPGGDSVCRLLASDAAPQLFKK